MVNRQKAWGMKERRGLIKDRIHPREGSQESQLSGYKFIYLLLSRFVIKFMKQT